MARIKASDSHVSTYFKILGLGTGVERRVGCIRVLFIHLQAPIWIESPLICIGYLPQISIRV